MKYTSHKAQMLGGRLVVPGDKSISHRAVMLGGLAKGVTEVSDCLLGEDVLSTMQAMRTLGVTVEQSGNHLRIEGTGGCFTRAPVTLDMGNSGTSMRLMSGLLAGRSVSATLVGDASLMKRPMERVAEPLRRMGGDVACLGEGGRPPVQVGPVDGLTPVEFAMPIASAQVKSAIMLAALTASGTTLVEQPAPSRDHSERMLAAFGADVTVSGLKVSVRGPATLRATSVNVPADISSAAFFIVAASIVPGSQLTLPNVGMNPTRTGVIDILRAMGADIQIQNVRASGGEPVADIVVRAARLVGIEIPAELVPNAIDEFPILFVAAACASGTTLLRGAEELRYKESDRIAAMARGLRVLGVQVEEFSDGLAVTGGPIGPGAVHADGDHRIAMSFAVAGSVASGPVEIDDCAAVATSFPNFVALAERAGMRVDVDGA